VKPYLPDIFEIRFGFGVETIPVHLDLSVADANYSTVTDEANCENNNLKKNCNGAEDFSMRLACALRF